MRRERVRCTDRVRRLHGAYLFHFIEEAYGVWLAAHLLRQLSACVISDISRWRSDHAADGVRLHVFAHVHTNDVLLIVEQLRSEGL